MINIRQANMDDAYKLSLFIKKLDLENKYLLYEQNERKNDIFATKLYLEKMQNNPKNIIFIAENEYQEIIGFACGEVSFLKKLSHVMKGNIGILKKYHGRNTGRLLAEKTLLYAKKMGIVRIEATIIRENVISLNLSKKFGFKIEGIKHSSIKIGQRFHDEYLVAKIINQS